MTDESKSETEKWIEQHKPSYPFAYYSGPDLPTFANQRGFPHAILIDPTGEVVWAGHPSSLTGSTIESHLAGAMPIPLHSFPKAAQKVRQAIRKDNLQQALEEARELEADGVEQAAEIVRGVQGMIDLRVAHVERAFEAGNFLKVVERGRPLVDALDELPQAAAIAQLLERVDDDDSAQAVLKAQKKLGELRSEIGKLRKQKAADDLIDDIRAAVADLDGTYAAQEAQALVDRIRELRSRLR